MEALQKLKNPSRFCAWVGVGARIEPSKLEQRHDASLAWSMFDDGVAGCWGTGKSGESNQIFFSPALGWTATCFSRVLLRNSKTMSLTYLPTAGHGYVSGLLGNSYSEYLRMQ